MKQQRVLPADIYDALELSALANDGIGAGTFGRPDANEAPNCAIGHAMFLDVPGTYGLPGSVRDALRGAGIGLSANDTAVRAINARLGGPNRDARVPFSEWAQELGVVRGDA